MSCWLGLSAGFGSTAATRVSVFCRKRWPRNDAPQKADNVAAQSAIKIAGVMPHHAASHRVSCRKAHGLRARQWLSCRCVALGGGRREQDVAGAGRRNCLSCRRRLRKRRMRSVWRDTAPGSRFRFASSHGHSTPQARHRAFRHRSNRSHLDRERG